MSFDNPLQQLIELTVPRPIAEYHEDMGDVLWWKFPITEAPYVGSPLDCGSEVRVDTVVVERSRGHNVRVFPSRGHDFQHVHVGGWPGYHTHWTPIPKVKAP